MLERMIRGEATPIDLETVASVQKNIIGNCLCVLGDSMAMPVGSMVEKFRDEFDEAIEKGVPSAERARQRRRPARRGEGPRRARGGRAPVGGREVALSQPIRNAVTLVVDGREVIAPEGTMLVDAAKGGDVEIPVFCYEPKLGEPVGACRMCLVEIEGIPKLQTACSTPVRDGMVVYTQTDQVKEAQNAVVEFLLVNHPLDCPVCDKGGECPLQDIAMGWGPGKSRFTDPKRHFQKPLELSPLIAIDRERCILCYRCVRFSQEVAEDEQLQLLERGDRSFVGTFDERPYIAPFHGNIIELCPVGALTSYTYRFRARPWDIEQAGSVCTLCPSQCNVKFTVRDERVLRVLARDNHAVDDGWLCDKGRFAFQMFDSEDRITEPMVRAGDGSAQPGRLGRGGEPSGRERPAQRRSEGRGAGRRRHLATRRAGWPSASSAGSAASDLDCSPNPVDPSCSAELSRPELSSRIADLDYAGAILVLGTDPLHEMPILDLRIRKAVAPRRRQARWSPPSARPRSTAAPPRSRSATRPGEAAAFLTRARRRARRRGLQGRRGAYAEAGRRRSPSRCARVPDPVIVWGERLWREPGAVARPARDARGRSTCTRQIGPGLLEVPEESNARGLREVGCLPGAGPGLAADGPGAATPPRSRTARRRRARLLLLNADPVRTYPDGAAWRKALAGTFVVAISMFDDESTRTPTSSSRPRPTPRRRARSPTPTAASSACAPTSRSPRGLRPGWQVLADISTALGDDPGFGSAEDVFKPCATKSRSTEPTATRRSAAEACAGRSATQAHPGPRSTPAWGRPGAPPTVLIRRSAARPPRREARLHTHLRRRPGRHGRCGRGSDPRDLPRSLGHRR